MPNKCVWFDQICIVFVDFLIQIYFVLESFICRALSYSALFSPNNPNCVVESFWTFCANIIISQILQTCGTRFYINLELIKGWMYLTTPFMKVFFILFSWCNFEMGPVNCSKNAQVCIFLSFVPSHFGILAQSYILSVWLWHKSLLKFYDTRTAICRLIQNFLRK